MLSVGYFAKTLRVSELNVTQTSKRRGSRWLKLGYGDWFFSPWSPLKDIHILSFDDKRIL